MRPNLPRAIDCHALNMPTPRFLIPEWPAPRHVHALCSTRACGVSAPPFDAANMALHVADDPSAVAANRAALAQHMGACPVFMEQVHGCEVLRLQTACTEETPAQADGAFTTAEALACTVMVADCLPVLICHRSARAVGAAHAGWRSLAGHAGQGIIEALLARMRCAVPEADEDGWMAWLGPCIGAGAFEVGHEVRSAFIAAQAQAQACFRPSAHKDKWLADLPALARQRLAACGVHALWGNDGSAAWCTWSTPERWFSYRRAARTGRMAACIWLRNASDD